MHLIIYGPEGSGKGTQAKLLSNKLSIPVLTSGDLVREKAKESSPLGKICLQALKEGKYVDDNTMFELWKAKLNTPEAQKSFILDGFPRNLNQAKFLLKVISSSGYSIDKFIYIKLTDDEAIKRLVKRNRKLFVGSEESHDSPERVKSRLEVFHKMEAPLVQYFYEKKLLLEVDGGQEMDKVLSSIVAKLDSR